MQHTPKELAQLPSAVPELEHSVPVIQTPVRPAVDTAEHSLKNKKIVLKNITKMFPTHPYLM